MAEGGEAMRTEQARETKSEPINRSPNTVDCTDTKEEDAENNTPLVVPCTPASEGFCKKPSDSVSSSKRHKSNHTPLASIHVDAEVIRNSVQQIEAETGELIAAMQGEDDGFKQSIDQSTARGDLKRVVRPSNTQHPHSRFCSFSDAGNHS